MRTAPLLLVMACLTAPLAAQGRTLDQVSDSFNSAYNAALPGWVWEQDIQVGITGVLAGLELTLNSYLPNDKVTVEIIPGAFGSGNAPVWTGRMGPRQINVWAPVKVDLLPFDLSFNAGEYFTVRILADSMGMSFQGNAYFPNDGYPAGALYENGQLVGSTHNMGFQTWMWTGPNLAVTGSCPGQVQIHADGGTPGGAMAILHGMPGQYVQTDPNRPCQGVELYLAPPAFAGFLSLNGAGVGQLNVNLPVSACGRVLQLVDMVSCLPTNPVVLN